MIVQNDAAKSPALITLVSVCVLALIFNVLAAAPTGVAYAGQGGTPGAPDTREGKGPDGTSKGPSDKANDKALPNFLKREQNVLSSLDHRLEVAARVTTKAQAWIEKLTAAGKDPTGMQNGLEVFNAKVAEAQAARDQAASLLDAHAGFDADGNVTDRQQARSTLQEARTLLRQANKSLVQAVPDFRKAVNQYRKANKTQGTDDVQDQGGQGKGNKGQGQGKANKGQAAEAPEPTEQPGD